MDIVLCGAGGNMGREMLKMIEERDGVRTVAVVDVVPLHRDCPCYQSMYDVVENCDVVVDFSHRSSTKSVVEYALRHHSALVIATTGQTDEEMKIIEDASKHIAVFLSRNMSYGIAVLSSLVSQTAKAFPFADVEIIETHHSQKKDVPSGTALMLAKCTDKPRIVSGRTDAEPRQCGEVGISSLRLGNDIGKHEVIFDTGCERITLQHQAYSRTLYADGAMQAIAFIANKTAGLYDMNDLLKNRR